MSKIGLMRFNWLGPMNNIEGLIEDWKPKNCKTEKDYEKSLFEFLRGSLHEDISIIKQYGAGRSIIDLVIEEEVAIEIKANLKSTAAIARLLGQVDIMLDRFEKIFVVLCGDNDSELVKTLESKLEEKDGGLFAPHIVTMLCTN